MTQTSYILYRMQEYVNHGVEQINKTAPEVIIECHKDYYGIPFEDMAQQCRRVRVLRPRQVLLYLLRKYSGRTLYDIAKMFGQHHTTVIHTVQVIENDRKQFYEIELAITTIERKIRTVQNAINIQKLNA